MLEKIGRYIGLFMVAVIAFIVINGAINSISFFSPKKEETVEVQASLKAEPISKKTVRVLCFNTGYASLGAESSLSSEGGRSKRADADTILRNVRGIAELSALSNSDAVLLQSVDVNSFRSRYVDQYSYYLGTSDYNSAFAFDHKSRSTSFFPPYKTVKSGVLTLSKKQIISARRVSIPSFSGAFSGAKPRRCMLVSEMPIKDSDKKLILINFELDAYLSPEQKKEQTKAVISYAQDAAKNGDYVIAGGSFYRSFDDTAERYPLSDRLKWSPSQMNFDELPSELTLCYDATVPTARILSKHYDARSEERDVYVADGYILSKNLEIKMIATVDQEFRYSCHNPVLLEVNLK